ncbi:MAG TPA: ATP-binding protein [Anaerolineales bacterium]|nr:ATP-binding protein [Anaerolineales bacterium]
MKPVRGPRAHGEIDEKPVRAQVEPEALATRRTRVLLSAFEFSQEIVAELDLTLLIQSVTDRALALTRAKGAALCLLEEDGLYLRLAATSGESRPSADSLPYQSMVPAGRVIAGGETVVVDAACALCGFQRAHAAGLCAAAPLRTGAMTLGALCVVRGDRRAFHPDETLALTLLANSAAIAISNARLAEAGRAQAKRAAALAERELLAAELHDELAQTLSFLGLKIERALQQLDEGRTEDVVSELAAMEAAVASAFAQVRAALTGLREPEPPTVDLRQRLAECLEAFRRDCGIPAEIVIGDESALAMNTLAQAQAVAIVREALANTRRHAGARQVRVVIGRQDGQARIAIEDDGRGFETGSVSGDHHLGLAIMRARAERLGGRLSIDSSPRGTRVTACLPLIPLQNEEGGAA